MVAKLGANVTLSDFVPHVLDNLNTSIASNDIQARARVVRLNWADEAGVSGACSNHGWYVGDPDAASGGQDVCLHANLEEGEQFEVIVGSDICYEDDHPALLEGVLRKRLAPGGRLFLLYAVRFPGIHAELLHRLAAFCRCTC